MNEKDETNEPAVRLLTDAEAALSDAVVALRRAKHVHKLHWNHVPPQRQERIVTANQSAGTKDRPRSTNTPHVNPNKQRGTKAEKKAARRKRTQERLLRAFWTRNSAAAVSTKGPVIL